MTVIVLPQILHFYLEIYLLSQKCISKLRIPGSNTSGNSNQRGRAVITQAEWQAAAGSIVYGFKEDGFRLLMVSIP